MGLCFLFGCESVFQSLGRDSYEDAVGRDIPGHHTICANDRALTNAYAAHDCDAVTDPDVIFEYRQRLFRWTTRQYCWDSRFVENVVVADHMNLVRDHAEVPQMDRWSHV